MSQQRHEWRGYGDEYGTRVDDVKIVSIRVGVIQIDGHLSVAISVAATPPVTITSRTAAGLGELMQWAQDEHTILAEQAQQSRAVAGRPPPDVADVNQAMTWLNDIATQICELRARFPAPPAAGTGALADHENDDG